MTPNLGAGGNVSKPREFYVSSFGKFESPLDVRSLETVGDSLTPNPPVIRQY